MQNYVRISILTFLSICLLACGPKENEAESRLESARKFYSEKQYAKAKQEIDSIRILYPKSVNERRQSLLLLDSVRREENNQIISECDSLIILYQPEVDKMKTLFTYQRDKTYQETGTYIPKESFTGGQITNTTLRPGVEENGRLFIESVFIGGKQRHNKI